MSDNKATTLVKNDNNCGFTLLELVIVVLIIGILAQVSLSYMVNFQAKAKDSIAIHDGRNLLTAVQTSFANWRGGLIDYEHSPSDGREIGSPSTEFTLNPGVMARITAGSKRDTTEGNGWFEAWIYHSNGTDDAGTISGKREFMYFMNESANIYSLPSF